MSGSTYKYEDFAVPVRKEKRPRFPDLVLSTIPITVLKSNVCGDITKTVCAIYRKVSVKLAS